MARPFLALTAGLTITLVDLPPSSTTADIASSTLPELPSSGVGWNTSTTADVASSTLSESPSSGVGWNASSRFWTAPTSAPVSITSDSAQPSVTQPCPSLDTTTVTMTGYFGEYTYTGTKTYTYTQPEETYITVEEAWTVTESLPAYTTTLISNETLTTTRIIANETYQSITTTLPTSSGFTPVLCEATWRNPTAWEYITNTYTVHESAYESAASNETATFTTTVYSTTTTETVTHQSDVIITSTSIVTTTISTEVFTATAYEACATNNVVSTTPDGFFLADIAVSADVVTVPVSAVDAVDCCQQCHSDPYCAGSVYNTTTIPDQACGLLIPNSRDACDPSFVSANVQLRSYPDVQAWISNGNCGQIQYQT